MASPGLLRACLDAAALHPRPVVATLNYQLGHVRQLFSDEQGYDQAAEDRLLAEIGWPEDGYRLFDISTAEIADPKAPMIETNALFMPGTMWDELGGYDEAFLLPGGGLVNPDAFSRAAALPDSQLIRVLGEGTFHQIHGGVTTSARAATLDYVKQASRDYHALRGRPLAAVRKSSWYFYSREGVVERDADAQPARSRSTESKDPSAII
jgi:hypothetical protein